MIVPLLAGLIALLQSSQDLAKRPPEEWPVLAKSEPVILANPTTPWAAVSGVTVTKRGDAVVWDVRNGTAHFFDGQGRFQGIFGRRGEGPGEFRTFRLHGVLGDTLWAADIPNRRVTFFLMGRQLKIVPLPPAILDKEGAPLSEQFAGLTSVAPSAILADGSFVYDFHLGPRQKKPPWYPKREDSGIIVVTRPNGRFISATVPVALEVPGECYSTKGSSTVLVPFCGRQFTVYAEDGGRVAFVGQPTGMREKENARYRIEMRDLQGNVIYSATESYLPVPIPRPVLDSARRSILDIRGLHADARTAANAMRIPASYPPLQAVRMGYDGSLWVQLWNGDWQVRDPAGRPFGRLRLPRTTTLLAASEKTIFVREEDADGEVTVVRYTVRR